MDSKTPSQLTFQDISRNSHDGIRSGSALGRADRRAMARIGKVQELRRQFGPSAMLGFAITIGVSFQSTLIGTLFSLSNGGPGGAIIMFIITAVGLTFVCFSLAEMSSIAPTAGGQYHWVSELAPARIQKPWSYFVGWTTNYAWQFFVVSSTNASLLVLEGCIALYVPGYAMTGWQQGLAVILLLILQGLTNIYMLPFLPSLEFFNLFLNIAAFIAFEMVMLVMGPRVSPQEVFQTFNNENGWSSVGLATIVGFIGAAGSLTNADSTVHMGEELKNASVWLPRVVVIGGILNYTMGFITLITFLFRASDISAAIAASPGMPFVAVLENITNSKVAALIMGLYVVVSSILASTNMITTCSRQLYAFARDGGVPGGNVIRRVNLTGVPVNAIVCTVAFSVVMAFILMGSNIAFNILTSLALNFLFGSYMFSIGTVLFRRLTGALPKAPFSLGWFGVPVNIAAFAFTAFAFVMLFFPPVPNPSLADMNWSCVVFAAFEIFPIVLYLLRQRHIYIPPRVNVREVFDDTLEMNDVDRKDHIQ